MRWPEGGTWAGMGQPGDPGWSWGPGGSPRPALLVRLQVVNGHWSELCSARVPRKPCSRFPRGLSRGFRGGLARCGNAEGHVEVPGAPQGLEDRGCSWGGWCIPGSCGRALSGPGGAASRAAGTWRAVPRVWSAVGQVLRSLGARLAGTAPSRSRGGVWVGRGACKPSGHGGAVWPPGCSAEKAQPSLRHLYC